MNIDVFIKRRPVMIYFILVFVISWGGLLIVAGPGGIPARPGKFEKLLPMAILALLAGPSIVGILLTSIVYGRAGLREFLSRLFQWGVGGRWYAIALLAAPLLMLAILLPLSLLSPKFVPGLFTVDDKMAHLLFGILVGLSAGIFEEIGWTGFAIPGLRKRYSVLSTGLILGGVWAGWHLLPAIWFSGTVSGPFALTSFLLDPLLFLWAFRVLMVGVYDRTGSQPVAMLMHASLTGSTRIFTPVGIAGISLLTFDILWAAVLWGVIAVAVRTKGRNSAQ